MDIDDNKPDMSFYSYEEYPAALKKYNDLFVAGKGRVSVVILRADS